MLKLPLPASISQADFNAIVANLDAMNTTLSFLHTLNDLERASARRLGVTNMAMARRVEELGPQFPAFYALGHSTAELTGLMAIQLQLNETMDRLNELASRIQDTILVAENKAFYNAHGYYDLAKQGVSENVPGAEFVVDELAPFFENLGPGGGPPAGAITPTPNP